MSARIYKPAKSASQSGLAASKLWILEFVPTNSQFIDPIMGWTGTNDTRIAQLKFKFAEKSQAVNYAKSIGLDFIVQEPHISYLKPKLYVENFKTKKI